MSGYLTHSSTFSFLGEWEESTGKPPTTRLPMMVSSCEAFSVIIVEMMQVMSIMMTTPFSISLFTKYCPGATSRRMPIITIAMAPAAWAQVKPNIM